MKQVQIQKSEGNPSQDRKDIKAVQFKLGNKERQQKLKDGKGNPIQVRKGDQLKVSIRVAINTRKKIKARYRRGKSAPPQADSLSTVARERISYYELLRATNVLSDSNLIGSGSFGSVYKGVLRSGTTIAVKVFNLQLDAALKSFDTECEVLRSLRHRNLVKVINSCSNLDCKDTVLKYMPNGSLEKYLYSHNCFLVIRQRLSIMIDVACSLEYLHHGCSSPGIYCDLNPSNVFFDEDMVTHLSDFGISKLLGEDEFDLYTKTLATLGYIAPVAANYGLKWCTSNGYTKLHLELDSLIIVDILRNLKYHTAFEKLMVWQTCLLNKDPLAGIILFILLLNNFPEKCRGYAD
ncbi:receptor kinase-like protein Xa21 [Capsicum annuum]|uniref:receptor kinase-like protein Xa21 n=1 Tax=Capsicum annuum TaxID=4072 RepID=UPI001FB134F1|nr:receptor kinase-like protein Xa21 [Capsicum annuum]